MGEMLSRMYMYELERDISTCSDYVNYAERNKD